MLLTILQENLADGLKTVSSFVPSSPQLPLLESLLIRAEKGTLSFTATDLSIGARVKARAKVEEEGALAVKAKNFVSLVNQLPPGKILLKKEENKLIVESEKTRAEFNISEPDDFPKLKEGEEKATLNKEQLREVSEKVCFAAAGDETRAVLTAVKIEKRNGEQRTIATDGFRLSVKELKKEFVSEEEDVLVPARLFPELVRIIQPEEKIGIGKEKEGKTLILTFGDVLINAQLIEGVYPEFEKIIPQNFSTRAVFDRKEFDRSVRTAAIFARESSNIVRLKFEDNRIEISANSPQVGAHKTKFPAKIEGEDLKAAFNHRFLLEYLKSAAGEEIVFESAGPLKPGVFKNPDDPTYLHIIMPVRVQENG